MLLARARHAPNSQFHEHRHANGRRHALSTTAGCGGGRGGSADRRRRRCARRHGGRPLGGAADRGRAGRTGSPPRALRLRLVDPPVTGGAPWRGRQGAAPDDRRSKHRVRTAARRRQRVRPRARWRASARRSLRCARGLPVRHRHAARRRLRLRHPERRRHRQPSHGDHAWRLHRRLGDRHGAPALVARSAPARRPLDPEHTRLAGGPRRPACRHRPPRAGRALPGAAAPRRP